MLLAGVLIGHALAQYQEIIILCARLAVAVAAAVGTSCCFGFIVLIELSCLLF
jgi:hypothetical protein